MEGIMEGQNLEKQKNQTTSYTRSIVIQKHPHVFVVPFRKNETFIINPFSRTYAQANNDFMEIFNLLSSPRSIQSIFDQIALDDSLDEVFKTLITKGLVVTGDIDQTREGSPKFPEPSHNHLTIFPTHNCNLNCVYCYAGGGETKKEIDCQTIDLAIDHFFKHLDTKKIKRVGLDFHGGGEPTVALDKLKYATETFKKRCADNEIKPHISMATNLCFKKEALDWIISNQVDLTVSFDGLPEVQNTNRPFRNGKKSYDVVVDNIKRLRQANIPVGIRATVTKEFAYLMPEIVQNAHALGINGIHFEPVFEVGRCKRTRTKQPLANNFIDYFIKAFIQAIPLGIPIRTSGLRFMDHPRDHFCGACGTNFAVTPEGFLSTCFEVVHPEDPASNYFFFGRIDPDRKRLEIDEHKLAVLQSRTVDKIAQCKDCFLKWGCAGDCPVKAFRDTGSLHKVSSPKCAMIKELNQRILSLMIREHYIPAKHIETFEYKGGTNEK
jgi:uncharacterized protein